MRRGLLGLRPPVSSDMLPVSFHFSFLKFSPFLQPHCLALGPNFTSLHFHLKPDLAHGKQESITTQEPQGKRVPRAVLRPALRPCSRPALTARRVGSAELPH